MGFSGNRATRALVINRQLFYWLLVTSRRMNPQLAMEWLLDHAEDADASLDAPVTAESLSSMLTSVSRRAPPPARGPVAEDPAVSVTISFVLNYFSLYNAYKKWDSLLLLLHKR